MNAMGKKNNKKKKSNKRLRMCAAKIYRSSEDMANWQPLRLSHVSIPLIQVFYIEWTTLQFWGSRSIDWMPPLNGGRPISAYIALFLFGFVFNLSHRITILKTHKMGGKTGKHKHRSVSILKWQYYRFWHAVNNIMFHKNIGKVIHKTSNGVVEICQNVHR